MSAYNFIENKLHLRLVNFLEIQAGGGILPWKSRGQWWGGGA